MPDDRLGLLQIGDLPLGSDTFDDVRASLVARLAEHDAHRDVARSVVKDPGSPKTSELPGA